MQAIDFMYLAIFGVMLYTSILWLIVFLKNKRMIFKYPKLKRYPSITFLVPAYNEEKNIGNCLKSLVNLNYPKNKIKIIAINDGSTDRTEDIIKKFKKYGVKLINKRNEGKKSKALNYALKNVKIDTDLIACMDSDSFAEKNYLLKLVGYLENPKVGAVTACLKVYKTDNFIRRLQWVEYMFSIFFRKMFSLFDCQYVTPGAGTIFKTKLVKKLGGFDENNITEDMEMALRIHSIGYKIQNSINGIVYTDIPKTLKDLYKQRIRWDRGYIQNFKKYSFMVFNKKYGNLGVFTLPINFTYVGIIIFLFIFQITMLTKEVFSNLRKWGLINYAFIKPELNLSIFYIDIYTVFAVIFLSVAITTIWLVTKNVSLTKRENENMKNKKTFYFLYLFVFPFIFTMFWICAVIYELRGAGEKW